MTVGTLKNAFWKIWIYLKDKLGLLSDIFIVTHVDVDGICSGAIALRHFKNAEIIFSRAGRVHEVLKSLPGHGKILVISDLGLNEAYLEETTKILMKLKSRGWRIYWFDHHRWSSEAIKRIKEIIDVLKVDIDKVGGEVVCDFFCAEDNLSIEIAKIARDADMMIRADERTRLYVLALNGEGFKARKHILKLIARGIWEDENILRWAENGKKKLERSREIGRKAEIRITKKGSKYAFLDLRGMNINGIEAANEARKTLDIDFCVVIYRNDRLSLYIGRRQDVNILGIAKKFGGGGHPFSCGVHLKLSLKSKILSFIFGKLYTPPELKRVIATIDEEL